LNGPKAADRKIDLNVDFTDLKGQYGLSVENAVLTHGKPLAQPDATPTMSKATLDAIQLRDTRIEDAIAKGDLKIAGRREVSRAASDRDARSAVAGPLSDVAGEDRGLVNETEGIAEGIFHVERSFAPRSERDGAHGQASVTNGAGQSPQTGRPLIQQVEFWSREVDVLEVGPGFCGISVGGRAVQRQNHAAAAEVMSPRRNPSTILL
jgi:hypothetical protein